MCKKCCTFAPKLSGEVSTDVKYAITIQNNIKTLFNMKKLLLSFVAILCATSFASADGDYVGPNIQWWYTDTKQLVRFTGYGPMYDFDLSNNQAPWWSVNPYYYELADGITRIGNNAFYGYWLKSFNFPTALTEIGESAFMSSSFS